MTTSGEISTTFLPTQRVNLSLGPIAYRHSGSGPPLLLVHGWRGSSRYWLTTLERFAETHTVYALDLPGHGESPPTQGVSSAERLAQLILEFADILGLKHFDLNGHSLGAAIAVYVAAQAPERIRRLVLTCLGTFRNEFERFFISQAYYQWSLSTMLWRPWLAAWRPWLTLSQPWIDWLGSQPPVYRMLAGSFIHQLPSDELAREGVREFLRTDQLNALDGAISAGNPAFTTVLDKVAAPTLLVSGEHDLIMPSSGVMALAGMLAQSQVLRIDRCGHLPMIEQPDVYYQRVQTFLTADV